MVMNNRLMRPRSTTAAAPPSGTPASLLLRFDGNYDDSSPNQLTIYGDATLNGTIKKYGIGSATSDGNGQYLTTSAEAFNFGTGDFTIEWWQYIDAVSLGSNQQAIWGNGRAATVANGMCCYIQSSGPGGTNTLVVDGKVGGVWQNPMLHASAPFIGQQWQHCAVTRHGSTYKLWVDGLEQSSFTDSGTLEWPNVASASIFSVAGDAGEFVSSGVAAYIDDLRITNGLAIYTGPFIPPASPLAAYATPAPVEREASLLINFDGSFADESANGLTLTPVGSPAISAAEKRFGSGSLLLDGSSHLAGPHIDLSVGDCTIEFWFKALNGGGGQYATFFNNYVEAESATLGGFGIYFNLYSPGSGYIGVWASDNIVMSESAYDDGGWHHVALTKSGSYCTLYVDGVADGSGNASQAFSVAGAGFRIGSDQPGINSQFQGYIDDLRIVKGLAVYTGPFIPPTAPLTATASPVPGTYPASLLLNFDGSFVDDGIDAVQATFPAGAVAISGTEKKFGSGAARFNGPYITFQNAPNLEFGTGDFTVEAWIYRIGSGQGGIVGQPGGGLALGIDSTGFLIADQANVGGSPLFSSTAVPLGQWCHVAVTRNGGYARLFLNGQIVASGNWFANLTLIQGTLVGDFETSGSWAFDGYMDGLRITKACVYCGPFTPPTEPPTNTATTLCLPAPAPAPTDPYFSSVVLLLHMDGANNSTTFTDSSASGRTVTPVGNAKVSTAQSKFGGSSAEFDGDGDYLSLAPSAAFEFGTGDFTVEFFANHIDTFDPVGGGAYPHWFSINTYADGIMARPSTDGSGIQLFIGGSLYSFSEAISLSTWYHVALTRQSGDVRLFLDGQQIGDVIPDSYSLEDNNGVTIGTALHGLSEVMKGYIEEFRVTGGVARYTANFTPPTAAFPNS
ncbi:hypothetical protein EBZ80_11790 [bacterium]|nr:hypothetical protein [bacterium]